MGAAGSVGADQHLAARSPTWLGGRQLGQSGLGDFDVIDRGVRSGVALAQDHRDGFTGAAGAVVHPRPDGMKTESLLESSCC